MVELDRKGRGLLVASHDDRLIGRAQHLRQID
jgi:hypothetical protein